MTSEALECKTIQLIDGQALSHRPMNNVFCRSDVQAGSDVCVASPEEMIGEFLNRGTPRPLANCADSRR
jgi:hypothetical protein